MGEFFVPEEYKSLARRGLQLVSEESGCYFVKNEFGATFPVLATTVDEWVKEDKQDE